jgi:hypothetical protein
MSSTTITTHDALVGALSYAAQFSLTVVADCDLCPDLEVFVAGVQRSLEALDRSVGPTVC